MTTKKNPGRPSKTQPKPRPKSTQAYLDEERLRQLAELVRFNGSNSSKAIAQAISFHYAHLKKEWPNDIN